MCNKVCSYLHEAVVSLCRFIDLYIRSSFCDPSLSNTPARLDVLFLRQCCASATPLAGQAQGKHTSNKDNHCCCSFGFIVLSIISSSVAESCLSVCVVSLRQRMNEAAVGHILTRECKRPGDRQSDHTCVSAPDNVKPKTVALMGRAFTPHTECMREQQLAEVPGPLTASPKGRDLTAAPLRHPLPRFVLHTGAAAASGVALGCLLPARCCDTRIRSTAGGTVNEISKLCFSAV